MWALICTHNRSCDEDAIVCFYDVVVRYSQIDEDDRYTNNNVSGLVESLCRVSLGLLILIIIFICVQWCYLFIMSSESAATTTSINIAHDDYIIVHWPLYLFLYHSIILWHKRREFAQGWSCIQIFNYKIIKLFSANV